MSRVAAHTVQPYEVTNPRMKASVLGRQQRKMQNAQAFDKIIVTETNFKTAYPETLL